LHPPFSLFLPAEKERMRRARWKREKDGDVLRGRTESMADKYACPCPRRSAGGSGQSRNGPAALSAGAVLVEAVKEKAVETQS